MWQKLRSHKPIPSVLRHFERFLQNQPTFRFPNADSSASSSTACNGIFLPCPAARNFDSATPRHIICIRQHPYIPNIAAIVTDPWCFQRQNSA
jgi:hypothetical protein